MLFATLADKQKIEDGQPWLFNNSTFVIEPFDGFTQPQHLKFDAASCWIQLHQLPFAGMNKKCGEQIGKTLGMVEQVDVNEHDVGWGQSLRVKVRMDLMKPVARGKTVTIKGTKYWIPFKYEKLPRVCFKCGCIIHDAAACRQSENQGGHGDQFGTWLRAPLEGYRNNKKGQSYWQQHDRQTFRHKGDNSRPGQAQKATPNLETPTMEGNNQMEKKGKTEMEISSTIPLITQKSWEIKAGHVIGAKNEENQEIGGQKI